MLLFAVYRRDFTGARGMPEGQDCVYCCGGCFVARCGMVLGGMVAVVLGTVWFVERWDHGTACDSSNRDFGRNFVIAGWAAQLIFCWFYCCLPALRDGWELDRNEAISVALAPPGPDVEEAAGQPNPLSSDGADESLSLVSDQASAGPVATVAGLVAGDSRGEFEGI